MFKCSAFFFLFLACACCMYDCVCVFCIPNDSNYIRPCSIVCVTRIYAVRYHIFKTTLFQFIYPFVRSNIIIIILSSTLDGDSLISNRASRNSIVNYLSLFSLFIYLCFLFLMLTKSIHVLGVCASVCVASLLAFCIKCSDTTVNIILPIYKHLVASIFNRTWNDFRWHEIQQILMAQMRYVAYFCNWAH